MSWSTKRTRLLGAWDTGESMIRRRNDKKICKTLGSNSDAIVVADFYPKYFFMKTCSFTNNCLCNFALNSTVSLTSEIFLLLTHLYENKEKPKLIENKTIFVLNLLQIVTNF